MASRCQAADGAAPTAPLLIADVKISSTRVILLPWIQKDRTFYFVVDTGAASCCVTADVFPDLREIRSKEFKMHDGTVPLTICEPPGISVGPIEFKSLKSVIRYDIRELSWAAGRPIAGIIGLEALRPFVVQIDCDAGRVRFFKADKTPHEEWGNSVPLVADPELKTLTVLATVDGQPANFTVDTGCTDSGFLPDWWVDRLAKSSRVVTAESVTLSGAGTYRVIRTKDCELAGVHHRDLLFGNSKMQKPGLGMRFLRHYMATFDFPNGTFYLKKGKRFDVPDEHNMSGLHLVREADEVTVRSVDEGSPAARAGVKQGDVLLRINSAEIKDADLFELSDRLTSGDGVEIILKLRRDNIDRDVQFRLKKAI
jgi:hypothetical protein